MTLLMQLAGLCVIEVAAASRPGRGRWWRPNRAGYTNEINEAGLYTAPEAQQLESRPTHVARPMTDVLAELGRPVVKAEQRRVDRNWEAQREAWRRHP